MQKKKKNLFNGSHAGNLEELGHPTDDKNHRFIKDLGWSR